MEYLPLSSLWKGRSYGSKIVIRAFFTAFSTPDHFALLARFSVVLRTGAGQAIRSGSGFQPDGSGAGPFDDDGAGQQGHLAT
jgi:hypothetical protein